jgi:hypothetical protein
MWEPRPLTPLWAFTVCYRDSFTFTVMLHYSAQVRAAISLKSSTRHGRGSKPDLATVPSYPHCLQTNVDKRSVKKPETCSSIGSFSIHFRLQLIINDFPHRMCFSGLLVPDPCPSFSDAIPSDAPFSVPPSLSVNDFRINNINWSISAKCFISVFVISTPSHCLSYVKETFESHFAFVTFAPSVSRFSRKYGRLPTGKFVVRIWVSSVGPNDVYMFSVTDFECKSRLSILETGHDNVTIDQTVEILHTEKKGSKLNHIRKISYLRHKKESTNERYIYRHI